MTCNRKLTFERLHIDESNSCFRKLINAVRKEIRNTGWIIVGQKPWLENEFEACYSVLRMPSRLIGALICNIIGNLSKRTEFIVKLEKKKDCGKAKDSYNLKNNMNTKVCIFYRVGQFQGKASNFKRNFEILYFHSRY